MNQSQPANKNSFVSFVGSRIIRHMRKVHAKNQFIAAAVVARSTWLKLNPHLLWLSVSCLQQAYHSRLCILYTPCGCIHIVFQTCTLLMAGIARRLWLEKWVSTDESHHLASLLPFFIIFYAFELLLLAVFLPLLVTTHFVGSANCLLLGKWSPSVQAFLLFFVMRHANFYVTNWSVLLL